MIRLTGLLAFALLVTLVVGETILSPKYHVDHLLDLASVDKLAVRKVNATLELWPENFLLYEGNQELFDKTFAPNAIIVADGDLYAVGIKEWSKRVKKSYKTGKMITVDEKLEYVDDGTVLQTFEQYFINHGRSTGLFGEAVWKEIDGKYKVVYKSYTKAKKLL